MWSSSFFILAHTGMSTAAPTRKMKNNKHAIIELKANDMLLVFPSAPSAGAASANAIPSTHARAASLNISIEKSIGDVASSTYTEAAMTTAFIQ